jgi:threonine synthase
LKGLAPDGGLYIPEQIPSLPEDWISKWKDFSFQELALEILSLYISESEIPRTDLQGIVNRSYSTFRSEHVTPLVSLDPSNQLYLLELFHGPTFAFKDVALQFLGNLFEYFLVRRNATAQPSERYHLTIAAATSGDTGSAAIYGVRGKKDVSIYVLFPKGRVSPIQEAQMTTVLDSNVHNVSVEGTFDDCQEIVKTLFGDSNVNSKVHLGAVNSINWARILAQTTYYFSAYFQLLKASSVTPKVQFVVPTGNFGDILAGYFAKRMGLPIEKLVIATNENDILDRFWKSGSYEKQPVHGKEAEGGLTQDGVQAHTEGSKETLSPAMDILVSSNFERLLWYLAFEVLGSGDAQQKSKTASAKVQEWQTALKSKGGFTVESAILEAAKRDFDSERISDEQTLSSIRSFFDRQPQGLSNKTGPVDASGSYILDPHSSVGVTASLRKVHPEVQTVSLSTAHPAKFANAVDLALKELPRFSFSSILPQEFKDMDNKEKRLRYISKDEGYQGVANMIIQQESPA